MNNRSNLNLGDEIKNIVQDALNNKNFNKLNQDIQNVVNDALDEVRNAINLKPANQNKSKTLYNSTQSNFESINKRKSENLRQTQPKYAAKNYETIKSQSSSRNPLSLRPNKYAVPVGQVSNVLLTVFGSLGSAGFGIALFVMSILGFTIGNFFHSISLILLPFFIGSIVLLWKGNSNRKRLKRFQKYMALIKGESYFPIDELAAATGQSNKFIEKDLRKMIAIGMFPEGHIDNKRTTFILTNETYKQYLQVKYLEIQEKIANKNLKSIETLKFLREAKEYELEKEENKKISPEMRKSLDEGRRFLSDIKAANIAIPGEDISGKLSRLEEVTEKIYDYVELHPEKFVEIRKFTEYFLPTTLKLVEAYEKLDYQSVQGQNISNAKKEIEDTMDTINLAFENLLDDLFQDMAMDISTDISVLETILAQEGLTENEMRYKNKNMEDKQ